MLNMCQEALNKYQEFYVFGAPQGGAPHVLLLWICGYMYLLNYRFGIYGFRDLWNYAFMGLLIYGLMDLRINGLGDLWIYMIHSSDT